MKEIKSIIMFSGPKCGPCHRFKPVLLKLQDIHKFPVKVIDLAPATMPTFQKFGIRGTPTLACVDSEQKLIGTLVGEHTEASLEKKLREWGVISV